MEGWDMYLIYKKGFNMKLRWFRYNDVGDIWLEDDDSELPPASLSIKKVLINIILIILFARIVVFDILWVLII